VNKNLREELGSIGEKLERGRERSLNSSSEVAEPVMPIARKTVDVRG